MSPPPAAPTRRRSLAPLIALLILSVGIGAAAALILVQRQSPPFVTRNGPSASLAALGGAFQLTDQEGSAVTAASYGNRVRLVFFGFTFCPDICPTTLTDIAAALDLLSPAEQAEIAPLFISVDPERDTPAAMKAYVGLFDSRIQGLTGSREQIDQTVRAFKATAIKRPVEGPAGYLMDHSAYLYVTGPDGRVQKILSLNTPPAEVAAALRDALKARAPAG